LSHFLGFDLYDDPFRGLGCGIREGKILRLFDELGVIRVWVGRVKGDCIVDRV
jgi:hypothetical protein